ncbi:hypothetical protein [Endozoicomonas sp. SESOKO2]|nr:hypothetical protein [Endozoicomonas sp. SESOKO2]
MTPAFDLIPTLSRAEYNVHMLVYFEQHEKMESAIIREKQLEK